MSKGIELCEQNQLECHEAMLLSVWGLLMCLVMFSMRKKKKISQVSPGFQKAQTNVAENV